MDARILEAATRVFLERGFESASLEEIAEAARAGKASLYSRFSSKHGLFTAVIKRSIDQLLRSISEVPRELPLRDRLTLAGQALLDQVLTTEVVSLMRVIIAEATRFPELARLADELGRQRAIVEIAELMGAFPAPAGGEGSSAARQFLDLVFAPLQIRALLGENLAALRMEAGPHIARSIALFFAAGLVTETTPEAALVISPPEPAPRSRESVDRALLPRGALPSKRHTR